MVEDYLLEPGDRKILSQLYDVLAVEHDQIGGAFYTPTPISFRLAVHSINLEWVNVIHRMVFKERLFGLFYSEYSEILENVVNTTPSCKDYAVYRNHQTGDSIFHLAAKLWIIKDLKDSPNVTHKIMRISAAMKYVLECYRDLGRLFENGNEYTLTYLEDFSGDCLLDHVSSFCDGLSSSSF